VSAVMADNPKESLPIREDADSKSLAMKINGHNVTLTFSSERNDKVSNQIKQILLESYINKKL
jgi:hypothetical protein